jgi:hypothetical protein
VNRAAERTFCRTDIFWARARRNAACTSTTMRLQPAADEGA